MEKQQADVMTDFTRAVPLDGEERYISPEFAFRASFGPDAVYSDYSLPQTAVICLTKRLHNWTRELIGIEPVRSFTWSSVDCLHNECWQSQFKSDAFRTGSLVAIQIALDCALRG